MKYLFYLFSLFLLHNSCSAQDCKAIPNKFISYEQAKQIISNATFPLSDKVNTSKSSWVRAASYYSCDGKKGFFIIKTDSKEYIHQDMPLNIWLSFKSANSFGRFYNANIKHKYQLVLRQ